MQGSTSGWWATQPVDETYINVLSRAQSTQSVCSVKPHSHKLMRLPPFSFVSSNVSMWSFLDSQTSDSIKVRNQKQQRFKVSKCCFLRLFFSKLEKMPRVHNQCRTNKQTLQPQWKVGLSYPPLLEWPDVTEREIRRFVELRGSDFRKRTWTHAHTSTHTHIHTPQGRVGNKDNISALIYRHSPVPWRCPC